MNKTLLFRGLLFPALAFLSACGHAIHGNEQSVEVVPTGLPPGITASCTAENGVMAWHVGVAPGHLSVGRSRTDLTVECRTTTGWRGKTTVSPEPSPYSIGGSIASGALTGIALAPNAPGVVGGATAAANSHAMGVSAASAGLGSSLAVVGAGLGVGAASAAVDLHTGGAWIYPDKISVPMSPTRFAISPIEEAVAGPLQPLPRPPRAVSRPRPRPVASPPPTPACECANGAVPTQAAPAASSSPSSAPPQPAAPPAGSR